MANALEKLGMHKSEIFIAARSGTPIEMETFVSEEEAMEWLAKRPGYQQISRREVVVKDRTFKDFYDLQRKAMDEYHKSVIAISRQRMKTTLLEFALPATMLGGIIVMALID